MAKLDLEREMKHLYDPSARGVTLVEVPPANSLIVGGSGSSDDSASCQAALGRLAR